MKVKLRRLKPEDAPLMLEWMHDPSVVEKLQTNFAGKTLNGYLTMANDISCLNWFTFYYLGITLGNKILKPKFSLKTTGVLLTVSIILQVFEGYALYKLGLNNCGTQLKLTSLLTSSLTCIFIYTLLLEHKIQTKNQLLLTIGEYSFGIYLSHILFNRLAKEFAFYASIPYVVNAYNSSLKSIY